MRKTDSIVMPTRITLTDTNKSQFKVSKVTPAYWRLTFNNPPINMLDPQTILQLQDLVSEFETDPQLKVVVSDSAGSDFFMSIAHNKQETPLLAASIERHAHRRTAAA
jgi:enoyl-CoA hydratase/carnithine racemase